MYKINAFGPSGCFELMIGLLRQKPIIANYSNTHLTKSLRSNWSTNNLVYRKTQMGLLTGYIFLKTFAVLGLELRTPCLLDKHYIIELHPQHSCPELVEVDCLSRVRAIQ